MRTRNLLCILMGALSLVHAHAQTAAPQATPPPLGPGPLIAKAPASSQWLMSRKAGLADRTMLADPQTKYDQRTLVTITRPIRREIVADSAGGKTEIWYSAGVQGTYTAGQRDPVITISGANPTAHGVYNDYSKTDFPGFEWITRHNYTGVQMMQGIPCIVFHDGPVDVTSTAPVNPNAPLPIPQTGSTAYIASDSRLPILLQTDDGFTVYQWDQPPSSPLSLPAAIQQSINTFQTRTQAAAAPAAIP